MSETSTTASKGSRTCSIGYWPYLSKLAFLSVDVHVTIGRGAWVQPPRTSASPLIFSDALVAHPEPGQSIVYSWLSLEDGSRPMCAA